MNNRKLQQGQRLQAEVTQPSLLSFEEAQERLPELVVAELAGEDVDTIFRDVFLAFNHYPALADQYTLLLEEMRRDLADLTPVPEPTPTARIVTRSKQTSPGIVLRQLGEQVRGFLVQMMPRPLPEPISGYLSDEPVEYISDSIPDQQDLVELTVVLQPLDEQSWSLVVLMIPDSAAAWQVTATISGADLPVISSDPFETRFGPLAAVPTEPITLLCRPRSG